MEVSVLVGLSVCCGGGGGEQGVVGLLSRIHFPPDHNAIIGDPLYCASQHKRRNTHTQIYLTLFRI